MTFSEKEIKVIKEIFSNYTEDWINNLFIQLNMTDEEILSFWAKLKVTNYP